MKKVMMALSDIIMHNTTQTTPGVGDNLDSNFVQITQAFQILGS